MDFLYLIKFILYKGGLKNNRRLFLTFYEERIKKKKKLENNPINYYSLNG